MAYENDTNFVATKHLKDKNEKVDYINAMCSDKDDFLFSLKCVATAHGFRKLSKDCNISFTSIYKSLMVKKDPGINTILKILHSMRLGIKVFSLENDSQEKIFMRKHSLAYLYPKIAREWHPTKNKLTPNDILPGDRLKVWWKCLENNKHEWQQSCNQRVIKYSDCPECRKLL